MTAPVIDRSACPGIPGAHDPCRVGKATAYKNWGCRCDDAALDRLRRRKRLRAGIADPAFIDPTATARRLQALAAIGWPIKELADRLGYSVSGRTSTTVAKLRRQEVPTITPETERKVADLYRELWDVPGPDARARRWAARHGWVPPLAWDEATIGDPKALPQHDIQEDPAETEERLQADLVRQLLAGATPELPDGYRRCATGAKRHPFIARAVRAMTEAEMSADDIGRGLGLAARSAVRIRTDLGVRGLGTGRKRSERHWLTDREAKRICSAAETNLAARRGGRAA